MPTILVTGCSSGFGLDTARLFLDRGWDVIATMRTIDAAALPASDRLRIVELDVTDPASVTRVVAQAGPVDVLVNNAGFGVPSPIELTEPETARSLFETNTLGTLAMIQASLPGFRERREGVIINISSSTTLKPLPLIGLYRASKMAVNAITESLAQEVHPFGIRVHLVLPGRAPETRFGANAMVHLRGRNDADYGPMIERILAGMQDRSGPVTHPSDVTEAVWRAATDPASPFRLAAGADAEAWMAEASG
ncbi:SDR family oxidoreductase [Rhizobium bangladeshense]|uniref:SDR family oxidoreductase n=1 Tax=Rhizobium bangladeshense TaxID=1138189 RepID=UPI001C82C4A5|nr:SDR family oxidoreductase [Rhizobium bangladeshense]MBX4898705.1 SDR family oxidoreductase [Rhizobium bangladeshense]MBY3616728.1 SDR family oxidoreductase [Rhizobium bangladeshense]